MHEYLRGRDIEWQKGWVNTRTIVSALTGMAPIDIIRLPDIDPEYVKTEWTPELAEQTLKHFGEWPT